MGPTPSFLPSLHVFSERPSTYTHQNVNLFCFLCFVLSNFQMIKGGEWPGWVGGFVLFPSWDPSRSMASLGARGVGKKTTAMPVSSLSSSSPQTLNEDGFWDPGSPGQFPLPLPPFVPPPISFPSWVMFLSHLASASSLHVTEGPGSPQVSCLSNKVETTRSECQATISVGHQRARVSFSKCHDQGAKLSGELGARERQYSG